MLCLSDTTLGEFKLAGRIAWTDETRCKGLNAEGNRKTTVRERKRERKRNEKRVPKEGIDDARRVIDGDKGRYENLKKR